MIYNSKILSLSLYLFVLINVSSGQVDANLQKAKDVLDYMNLARTNPAGFANDYIFQRIKESREAEECFDEMVRLTPETELTWSENLYRSAFDHAEDIGSNGLIGHTGSDSSDLAERVERYAKWKGSIAENIYYGSGSPLEIVILFLIDEGIEDRGHRENILNANFQFTGIAVYPHFYYGTVCVIHYAENLK